MARLQQLSLLIVAVLLFVVVNAWSQPNTTSKHPRCHPPVTVNCSSTPHKMNNNAIVGWYYFRLFKSCHPLYSVGGVHDCEGNKDLPGTREHCEDLCGESCTMDNGTIGICTFEEFCRKPPHSHTVNRTPCKAYGVNCCSIKPRPVNKLLYFNDTSIKDINDVDYDSSDDRDKIIGHDVHAIGRPKSSKPLGL